MRPVQSNFCSCTDDTDDRLWLPRNFRFSATISQKLFPADQQQRRTFQRRWFQEFECRDIAQVSYFVDHNAEEDSELYSIFWR